MAQQTHGQVERGVFIGDVDEEGEVYVCIVASNGERILRAWMRPERIDDEDLRAMRRFLNKYDQVVRLTA